MTQISLRSLPHRQLRKVAVFFDVPLRRSLPHRQLRKKTLTGKSAFAGKIGGFSLYVENLGKGLSNTTTGMVIVSGKQDYEISFSLEEQSYDGLAQKIVNQVKRIKGDAQAYELWINEKENELPELEAQVGPFKKAQELDRLKLRKKEVLAQLRSKDEGKKQERAEAEPGESYMLSAKTFDRFWGEDHSAAAGKGQAAVKYLLKVKSGHVVAAFTHPEIGDIDLVWGDDDAGLQHIIARRTEQWGAAKTMRFINHLQEIVEGGIVRRDAKHPSRLLLINPKSTAVIELTFNAIDKNWLMSAFVDSKNKKRLQAPDVHGEPAKSEPVAPASKNGAVHSNKASSVKSSIAKNAQERSLPHRQEVMLIKEVADRYRFHTLWDGENITIVEEQQGSRRF